MKHVTQSHELSHAACAPASTTGGTSRLHHCTSPVIRGYRRAAVYLGISERTLWSLVNIGAVPHRRVGRAYLFHRAELDAWFDAGCPTDAGAAERVREGVQR
jgi:excisionase family DNA binding protein